MEEREERMTEHGERLEEASERGQGSDMERMKEKERAWREVRGRR